MSTKIWKVNKKDFFDHYFLGDYVKTKKNSHLGRICRTDSLYRNTGVRDDWSEMQRIPITDEELKHPWYSILCKDGGAVYVSENDLIKVDSFILNHPNESEYFENN